MAEIRTRYLERRVTWKPCDSAGCTIPNCRSIDAIYYETLDGTRVERAEPGDVFEIDHEGSCPVWDNCSGTHVYVVLPDRGDGYLHHWNVDGRCSNCTLPEDREHRCWVRSGDPRAGTLHVDKNGRTCAAGAGSILSGKYHGFLHGGVLRDC